MDTSGTKMLDLMVELYPLCRSITGDGVRQTLDIIGRHIELNRREIPTGTKVFDWTVPKEWVIRDAYIVCPNGCRIAEFKKNNLHVLGYSIPVNEKISLSELKKHLYTLPDQPDLIPYRTTYYDSKWGFCIEHALMESLSDGEYHVVIDSELKDGSLSIAECFLPGESSNEFLFSTYTCHPSLCSDNLSGIVVLTHLAKWLATRNRKYSYRFLFIPETIGAIAWLAHNHQKTATIKYGLVATCLAIGEQFTYKKTRSGTNRIDHVVQRLLSAQNPAPIVWDYNPLGSDERQYCSPGFNMPVGCLMRSAYAHFPHYHTSADNLSAVKAETLHGSLALYKDVVNTIEHETLLTRTNPHCEPNLGSRGVYSLVGGLPMCADRQKAILWILNLADGLHSVEDIAWISGISQEDVHEAAQLLISKDLVTENPY